MEKPPLTTLAGTVAVADLLPFKMDKQFCSCTLFSKQNDRARTLWGMGREGKSENECESEWSYRYSREDGESTTHYSCGNCCLQLPEGVNRAVKRNISFSLYNWTNFTTC